MEKIWYLIVDQWGEEIQTESEREATTAFRSGGIVTIVREIQMYLDDDTLVLTRVYTNFERN